MSAPNVLLIVLDAVRRDHLSCYGHVRETSPSLDRFAAEGTRYTQAVSTAPWTAPSHASMFTGQYPSRHGVYRWMDLDADAPSVAAELSAAGYETYGFSNSFHTSTARGYDRGFEHYHDLMELPRVRGRMFEVSLPFLRFLPRYFRDSDDVSWFQLEKLKAAIGRGEDPFFAFVNLNSAHSPYDAPDEYRERFEADFERWDEVDVERARALAHNGGDRYILGELEPTEAEWDLVRRWYDAEIAYVDDLLADLFDYLRSTGQYEETLIAVVSDHGEHFGEHGLAYHKFSLSAELIDVPLLIKWPASDAPHEPGAVSDELVSLVDLAPTFLDVAGAPVPEAMEGRSLAASDSSAPEAVFAEYGGPSDAQYDRFAEHEAFERYDRGLQAVRTSNFKLVRGTDGTEALYRIEDDGERPVPAEEYPDDRDRLDELLSDRLTPIPGHGDTDETSQEELDDHVRDHLQEMGYL